MGQCQPGTGAVHRVFGCPQGTGGTCVKGEVSQPRHLGPADSGGEPTHLQLCLTLITACTAHAATGQQEGQQLLRGHSKHRTPRNCQKTSYKCFKVSANHRTRHHTITVVCSRAERSEFIQQKYVALAFVPPLTERLAAADTDCQLST